MDKIDIIYDIVCELREQQKVDHEILLRHQQMSESNKRRLDIVESKAFLINWKQVSILAGVISSLAGAVYYIVKAINSGK